MYVGSSAASTTIDIFNEPICPPCGSFIRSNSADIDTAVNNKKLAVRYHLLNFLDDKSHSKTYSTRAVAASYCVAAQDDPKLYSQLLLRPVRQQLSARGKRRPKTAPTASWPSWPKTCGADAAAITCIKSGDDVGTAKAKAATDTRRCRGSMPTRHHSCGMAPSAVNYQDATWLTKLVG